MTIRFISIYQGAADYGIRDSGQPERRVRRSAEGVYSSTLDEPSAADIAAVRELRQREYEEAERWAAARGLAQHLPAFDPR